MAKTFFFYDLETSGLNPREDRVMQFAGIRTDMDLNPVGEPMNILVKLNDDTLPSPEAILVTGITPQATKDDGYSEAEFAKTLYDEVFTPDTITIGFNSIRFDDEFIRYLLWRNFYDPYEWAWSDGRSRWDMLDVVRMTRAIRPVGIEWPVNEKGEPVNKLELLSKVNGLAHEKAHDALSDVEALISVAKLIKQKQPQLFEYLLNMRDKKEVKKLVNLDDKRPFVYSSGRYDTEYNKTTVSFPLTAGKNGNVLVYDLRYDPTNFLEKTSKQLAENIFANYETRQQDDFVKVPVKELQYNRVPAVAPLGVLESGDGWAKIKLDKDSITKHRDILLSNPTFAENIRSVFENREEFEKSSDAEAQLYDSFVPDVDKLRIEKVRGSSEAQLADFNPNFNDERLSPLLLHYKARNYPRTLSEEEVVVWEKWRSARIMNTMSSYINKLQAIAAKDTSEKTQFLLQELQLWAESIMPVELD